MKHGQSALLIGSMAIIGIVCGGCREHHEPAVVDSGMSDTRDEEHVVWVSPQELRSRFIYSEDERVGHITLEVGLEGPWRAVALLWGELVNRARDEPGQFIEIVNPSGQVIQFVEPGEEGRGLDEERVHFSPEERQSFPFEYKGDEITRIVLPLRLVISHELLPGFFQVRLKPDGLPIDLSFNEYYDQDSVNVRVHVDELWHAFELEYASLERRSGKTMDTQGE